MNETSLREEFDVLKPVLARLPKVLLKPLQRSRRVTQLARDVVMIARGVLGPPQPVVRIFHEQHVDTVVLPGERRLKVLAVRQETAAAMSLVIERPEDVEYEAGQFLTLVLPIDGQELRRSYSLSSSPLESGPFVITIKKVSDGVASNWLHHTMRSGATLRVRGPSGTFVYQPSKPPGRLVLIGGGSGITPLMGILRTALVATPHVPVHLVYANRSAKDVIFREELRKLQDAHSQFTVQHVLEQDGELPCIVGRVGRSDLVAALEGDLSQTRVYLCGPDGMMEMVQRELMALGLDESQLHVERFVTIRVSEVAQDGRLHLLQVGGRQVEIPVGQTLLEGATGAGIDLDFSCTMGGCGTCMARLLKGDVVMDEPNCLSAAERKEGMILTCVARPLSDVIIERLS